MVLRALMGVAFALVLTLACRAQAQSEADKTTARNLFFEARDAHAAGRFDEAADLFRRSNELYPAPTAALGLARALRDAGRLVAAYETYVAIVNRGAPAGGSPAFVDAVETAAAETTALEPRLAAVVVTVEGPEHAAVHIDGVEIPAAALGVKRFVDPGERLIEVAAEGYLPARQSITLGEGQIEAVAMKLEPVAVESPEPSPLPPPLPTPLPRKEPASRDEGSGLRTAGITVGSLGLASLVVAAVTGGLYLGDKAEVEDGCVEAEGGRFCSDPATVDAAERGRVLGLVNTITLPVGVAAVGVGTILFLIAPSGDEIAIAPLVSPDLAALAVKGRF